MTERIPIRQIDDVLPVSIQVGTVGHGQIHIRPFDYPIEPGGLLVLHNDGLSSSWRLDEYPGRVRRHPAVVAGVLHRDFGRPRDDATVLVTRLRAVDAER